MNRHPDRETRTPSALRAALVDLAGGVSLFVLLFAVLHLPIVT